MHRGILYSPRHKHYNYDHFGRIDTNKKHEAYSGVQNHGKPSFRGNLLVAWRNFSRRNVLYSDIPFHSFLSFQHERKEASALCRAPVYGNVYSLLGNLL
jgi:hypothetical protein